MINKEQFKGHWKQIKGKGKEKWGKLTDDELLEINGKKEALLGKLQTKYGYTKEKAEQELKNFENSFNSDEDTEDQEDFIEFNEGETSEMKEDWDEDSDQRKIG